MFHARPKTAEDLRRHAVRRLRERYDVPDPDSILKLVEREILRGYGWLVAHQNSNVTLYRVELYNGVGRDKYLVAFDWSFNACVTFLPLDQEEVMRGKKFGNGAEKYKREEWRRMKLKEKRSGQPPPSTTPS